MFVSPEDLSCDGVLPSGPVCPWPRPEGVLSVETKRTRVSIQDDMPVVHDTKVEASVVDMAKGLLKGAGYAMRNGRVSHEIREERYSTCQACPHFIEESKRCSQCGCFMAAKTWLAGDPKVMCPKQKWER